MTIKSLDIGQTSQTQMLWMVWQLERGLAIWYKGLIRLSLLINFVSTL